MSRYTTAVLSLVLGLCVLAGGEAENLDGEEECVSAVDAFLQRRLPNLLDGSQPKKRREYDPEDFVFFLHVPRTAGRSFWSCFLFKAFPSSRKCDRSYDSLRLELSRPDCKLLASHDDYSITDFFPENYSVITQARDPVDRVISAYEFALMVSAREFNPNVTKAAEKNDKVKTRDVWPWLYLVQLLDRFSERALGLLHKKQALFKQNYPKEHNESLDRWVESRSRKSGRTYYYHRRTRESKWKLTEEEKKYLLPKLDPYNNSLAIPLALFAEFPMVEDLVHNAMTYQVLGLTNASYWEEATEIRACSAHSRAAQEKLLTAAKAQLDRMLHISLTHKLDESLQSIAVRGWQGAVSDGVDVGDAETGVKGANLGRSAGRGTELSLETCRDTLTQLADNDLVQLLFKYRNLLDESRGIARSRRRSKLSKNEFLPKWDSAISNLEYVRVIQAEVLRRRKEKGESFLDYPQKPPDKQLKLPLWTSYKRCVNKAQDKAKLGKIRSMTNLAFPDERRLHFSKEARKQIPQSTIDLLREKNWMDVHLYEYALQLYDAQLKYQRENGLLEEIPVINPNDTEILPPPVPPKPVVHEEL